MMGRDRARDVALGLQIIGGFLLIALAGEALAPCLGRLLSHWPAWVAAGMFAAGTAYVHLR